MQTPGFSLQDYNFTRDLIGLYEFILAPLYLILIYAVSYIIRHKYYRNSPLKKYFIPGIMVKLIGAVGVALIYNYYYLGGDTKVYFNEGRILSLILLHDPWTGIRLLTSVGGDIAPDLTPYVASFHYANAENSFLIVKISAIIQLFSFQSFLVTSMFFGFLSFWGIWKLFKLFSSFYPELTKQFAFAFLFVPSVFFWGSGILKDTVCLACLAILFCCVHRFFNSKKNKFSNLLGILITGYILAVVKIYIIMTFALCISIGIFLNFRDQLKSSSLKYFITPIFIFFGLLIGYFILKILGENSGAGLYSLDNILMTAESTRTYIFSGGVSSYSLGDIGRNSSIWELISLIPAGVNVTLFRPYLWEAHNFVAVFSSIESLVILIISARILFNVGVFRFFKIALSDHLGFFCIFFSLTFAFAVGVSTYNFGTLVRYKIPCIPFYLAGIYIVHYIYQKKKILAKLKKQTQETLQDS